ncbi:NYN domain-containing protein [Nocardioides piscis]|uniref:NYN domain-containing protein n=1 Tax=Nocardioides piscis TaxID=2714938 RepID=A0A6G7YBY7_9ACTN|nr:NYN domain-containing protein [Nocardioides piscis]QIK74315.1 NYN domain-containing protein [Nocardioides piscis]
MDSDLHGGTRIAVLIDADNTSPKYAEALLEEVAKYGSPTIKRAYGDFSSQQLSGWTRELNARAIRPMHQIAFTTGKNSTDSALIIDAMDLLHAGNVEAFAIVSSDSDFTSLALRLRESGRKVYGLGRKNTPSSLQNACDRFIALEVLMTDAQEEAADEKVLDRKGGDRASEEKSAQESPSLNLQSALTKAVNATADDEGWATVSQIGNHLNRTHASFDPRNFGHGKLTALVQAQPYLETRGEANTLELRLKSPRKAAAAKKATSRRRAPAKSQGADATVEAPSEAPVETPVETPVEKPATPKVTVTTRTRAAKKTTAPQD